MKGGVEWAVAIGALIGAAPANVQELAPDRRPPTAPPWLDPAVGTAEPQGVLQLALPGDRNTFVHKRMRLESDFRFVRDQNGGGSFKRYFGSGEPHPMPCLAGQSKPPSLVRRDMLGRSPSAGCTYIIMNAMPAMTRPIAISVNSVPETIALSIGGPE